MPDPTTPPRHKRSPRLVRSKTRPHTTQDTPVVDGTPFKLSKSGEFDRQQRSVEAKVLLWRRLEEQESGSGGEGEGKEGASYGSPKVKDTQPEKEHEGKLGTRKEILEIRRVDRVPKKRIVSDEHWKKDRLELGGEVKTRAQTVKPRKSGKVLGLDTAPMQGSKQVDAWIRRKPPPRPLSPKVEETDKDKDRDKEKDKAKETKIDANELLLRYLTGSNRKVDKLVGGRTAAGKMGQVPTRGPAMDRFLTSLQDDSADHPRKDLNLDSSGSENGARSLTPPKPYSSRLDAWLGDTPDPFTESAERMRKSKRHGDTQTLSGSASPSDRSVSTGTAHSHVRNRHPERSTEGKDGKVTDRSLSEGKEAKYVKDDAGADSPTSTLRRRGATRSNGSPERRKDTRVASSEVASSLSVTPFDSISMRDQPRAATHGSKESQHRTSWKQRAFSVAEPAKPLLEVPAPPQTQNQLTLFGATSSAVAGPEPSKQPSTSLTRKLTTHEDLMSVLSLPVNRIKTVKSVRGSEIKPPTGSVKEVMAAFHQDEEVYCRDLRTLVDGVIPVLLSCVLSRSNSAKAAGLFNGRSNNTNTITGPIVQIGIALERLKSSHRRAPTDDAGAMVSWAESAARAYEEYFKVWRLGFQDVVVNLAPASNTQSKLQKLDSGWDDGLPRNNDGFVVSGDGERVDVASLLKRPLLRVKAIAATLTSLKEAEPSDKTTAAAEKFHSLTAEARKRHREERARLEDEAAADIDVTRARSPESLAPLRDVRIDPTRCVCARDYFDLALVHSSGQKLDCKAELIVRDDHPDQGGSSGDVLICEVDDQARWLLFPPVSFSAISAREGTHSREMVVMTRGKSASGHQWQELLTLEASDQSMVLEWLEMLGKTPVPPEIRHVQPASRISERALQASSIAAPLALLAARDDESQIPLGEQASEISSRWTPRQPSPMKHSMGHDAVASTASDSFSEREQRSPQSPAREKTLRWAADGSHAGRSATYSDSYSSTGYASTISHSAPSTPNGSRHPLNGPRPQTPPNSHDKHIRVSQAPSTSPRRYRDRSQTQTIDHHQRSSQPRTPTREQSYSSLHHSTVPKLSPTSGSAQRHRRSSSPLKNEYQPSDESDSSSIRNDFYSDDDEFDDDAQSVWSETSFNEDERSLPPISPAKQRPAPNMRAPPSSFRQYHRPDSVSPSQSASQSPRQAVSFKEDAEPRSSAKQFASIFSWSDKGLWETLHPQDCVIIVSPGLIEAFEITAETSKDINHSARPRPLIALELTPLVPLRKGTAIDITIRSPPTVHSLIRRGNNIMFRSRNNQECDHLYNLINQARINNPHYIALQNSRGPEGGWSSYMDRRAQERANGIVSSWWRFGSRRGSYRAKSTRKTLSVSGQTESTVGTVSSTMSALKRLSGGSRLFDLAKSTVVPRRSSKASSSLLTASSGSGDLGSRNASLDLAAPVGIRSSRIRFYQREPMGKWRDLGAATLAILHPDTAPAPAHPPPPAHRRALSEPPNMHPHGGDAARDDSPARAPGSRPEKRIVVTGKTAGETLFDATLPETAFERVARTGIAISVWTSLGTVASTGGVSTATMRVFMVQMRSEAEAAYTFSLVGRLRY